MSEFSQKPKVESACSVVKIFFVYKIPLHWLKCVQKLKRSSKIASLVFNFNFYGGDVFKIIIACLTLLAPFTVLADTTTSSQSSEEIQTKAEPRVVARFFSADIVQALPKLQHLRAQDPEFNKVLFKVEGYPKNQELIFEIKRLASKDPQGYQSVLLFSILDDGTILTNTQQRLKNILSSSRGFLPGERVTYRVRTADGSFDSETSGIPSPAVFKDNDFNVALRAELISISPTIYAIDLPTMKEGEDMN